MALCPLALDASRQNAAGIVVAKPLVLAQRLLQEKAFLLQLSFALTQR